MPSISGSNGCAAAVKKESPFTAGKVLIFTAEGRSIASTTAADNGEKMQHTTI
jgi:hypothetical protein